MALEKTTILSSDDELQSHLDQSDKSKILILGDDADTDELVQIADHIADVAEDLREVLWVKNGNSVQTTVRALEYNESLSANYGNVLAAGLDSNNAIRDVIFRDEPQPDEVRTMEVFANCES